MRVTKGDKERRIKTKTGHSYEKRRKKRGKKGHRPTRRKKKSETRRDEQNDIQNKYNIKGIYDKEKEI